MSEFQTINKALGNYLADGNTSLGLTNKVYVSIPDSSLTCDNLGLPSLPTNWEYRCSNSDNYRKVDSNGWIPVNFTSVSWGSPLPILPIDPINTAANGNYYTYVTGSSYELNTILESARYRFDSKIHKKNLPGVLAVGNNLSLSPIFNNSGMVGYWKFDEGSGTTASDSSGYGNTGTLSTGASAPGWTTGKVGGALSFDGVDDYVSVASISGLSTGNTVHTIEGWIKVSALPSNRAWILLLGNEGTGAHHWLINSTGGTQFGVWSGGQTHPTLSVGTWTHIAITHDGTTLRSYVNGEFSQSASATFNLQGIPLTLAQQHVSENYFDGLIDEVRIYNRTLSAQEISQLYLTSYAGLSAAGLVYNKTISFIQQIMQHKFIPPFLGVL